MASALLVIIVGIVLVALSTRRLDHTERRYAFGAYASHVLAAFGQVWLNWSYYHFSDMHGYADAGRLLARLLEIDFLRFFPDVIRLALHLQTQLPLDIFGGGVSTGTLSAIAGVLTYFIGPEPAGLCLTVAVAAMLGHLALYKVVRDEHPVDERRPLFIGLMLVPSVVFWSSGVAKEALALAFLSLLTASTYRFSRGQYIVGALGAAAGGLGVAMLKPYILFPFVLASAAWFYASRRPQGRPALRPIHLVLAIAIAVLGLAAMGSLFPEYSIGKVGETTATQQMLGAQATAGQLGASSALDIGDPEAKSWSQQLRFVPLALLNALFRPFVFEARNAPMLAAALESTILQVLVIVTAWRFKWARVRRIVAESPTVLFCVIFLGTFATAVGLATTNLGTLSRYRMPMMPFFATAVLLVYRRSRLDLSQKSYDKTMSRTRTGAPRLAVRATTRTRRVDMG